MVTCRTRILGGAPPSADGQPDFPQPCELHQAVRQKLAATGYAELRVLNLTVTGRKVVLRGILTSYYLKQVAQSVVAVLAGVEGVCNEIEVVPQKRK